MFWFANRRPAELGEGGIFSKIGISAVRGTRGVRGKVRGIGRPREEPPEVLVDGKRQPKEVRVPNCSMERYVRTKILEIKVIFGVDLKNSEELTYRRIRVPNTTKRCALP